MHFQALEKPFVPLHSISIEIRSATYNVVADGPNYLVLPFLKGKSIDTEIPLNQAGHGPLTLDEDPLNSMGLISEGITIGP